MRFTNTMSIEINTNKKEYGVYEENQKLANNKLGQLEDVEEKHGIKSVDDLDERLMALKFIKKNELLSVFKNDNGKCFVLFTGKYGFEHNTLIEISQDKYDLLKEVLS